MFFFANVVEQKALLGPDKQADKQADKQTVKQKNTHQLENLKNFPLLIESLPPKLQNQFRSQQNRQDVHPYETHAGWLIERNRLLFHAKNGVVRGAARVGLEAVIKEMAVTAQRDKKRIFFFRPLYSDDHREVMTTVNLGFAGGLAAHFHFLSVCLKAGVEIETCLELLTGLVATLKALEKETGGRRLPAIWRGTPQSSFYRENALLFGEGDLTMGYVLTLGGLRCGRDDWARLGSKFFLRGIARTPSQLGLNSPFLESGSIGIAHAAFRFAQATGNDFALGRAAWWSRHSERLFKAKHEARELAFVRRLRDPRKRGELKGQLGTKLNVFNSSLGIYAINQIQSGQSEGFWDATINFSNPVTGGLL